MIWDGCIDVQYVYHPAHPLIFRISLNHCKLHAPYSSSVFISSSIICTALGKLGFDSGLPLSAAFSGLLIPDTCIIVASSKDGRHVAYSRSSGAEDHGIAYVSIPDQQWYCYHHYFSFRSLRWIYEGFFFVDVTLSEIQTVGTKARPSVKKREFSMQHGSQEPTPQTHTTRNWQNKAAGLRQVL